jgi:putative hydrolase of the HAD superfamily
MLEILGLGSQILLALEFEQTYWRSYLSQAELFDGVKEFLDDIRILGIPMAIVTDLTAQIQFRKIIYFGLEQYFDYIVTSEECEFDKPYAGVFELALKKINPKGKYYWMIGDNPINDIKGAKKAIQAVTFQKIHSGVKIGKDDTAPDVIFYDFIQLRNLLFKITKEVEVNENYEVENL